MKRALFCYTECIMRIYSYFFAGVIILLVGSAMILLFLGAQEKMPPPLIIANEEPITTPKPEDIPEVQPAPETSSSMITVSVPLPNTTITSPALLQGQARGYWYFEASFPIRLVDEEGSVIAQTHGQAQGEWMTENFVPFTATLTWATTTGKTGTLIFMRDNPSGLPENDAEIRIPVLF